MNFDLDDPLEGLLSDGSNDSLFGNEPSKKPDKPGKPGKMEDLFGIKTDTAKRASVPKIGEPSGMASEKMQPASLDYAKLPTATTQQPSSLTSVQGRKTEPAPSKPVSMAPSNKPTTPQKKEISFDDSDLLADLGFDPKKPKSKSTILDDILGGPLTAATKEIPPKSIMAKPRQSLTTTLEEPQTISKAVSRQSTDTSENPPPESSVMGSYAPTGNNLPSFGAAPKRSGRRKSSVSMLNDPLGLFGGTTEEKGSRAEMKQPKKGGADWLGLNDDPVASEVEQVPVPSTTLAKPRDSIAAKAPPVAPVPPDVSAEVTVPPKPEISTTSTPTPIGLGQSTLQPQPIISDPQLITNTIQLVDMEAQNALATMQQQEIQLSIAGQMKNQEKALIEMQQKQQTILKRQEAQFNELLQKQMQRHTLLEDVLAKQQQRINANIQLIMSQPAPFASLPFGDRTTSELSPNDLRQATEPNATEKVELQTDVKRLEMEKLRLEDMVANLSANHEQELSILESSYKKQMTFLEESLRIMEARLKHDNKQLEDFYQAKITFVEQEKQKLIADHEAKAQSMEEHHRKVIEQLKQGYEESLEQLRQDHRESVAAIRESKMLEFSAIQDNQSYLQTLKSASSYLENASGDLQQLRDTLQDQIEFTQKEKELQLKQREKQLEDQQRLLDRTREATAEENVRLLNLVEMLESKVTEMTKISSQERWEYQQKCVKLEAERQSVDKEKQFLRERHEREEKRIDELKRLQLEEHSRLMDKVAQERQTLLEEKAKLETMAQLASTTNSIGTGTSRLEVEAALKVAEEAARQADSEKERYLQMQRQLESKRREMQTRESKLCEAKDELEAAIDRACQRERNAETVYRSLRKSEQNLQLKMQLIQRQFREVSEREDRLAKEKIEFSKERLELQAARRKLLQTRCSLCKIGDKSQEIAGDLLTTNTDSVADDLKLEANFAEMQNRLDVAGLRLDQHFDSDVDRQMKLFLERNQTDQCDDVELTESQRRHREIDRDLALLNFDALFPHLRSGEET
ncbi:fas-binding factor 1 [Anopheles gambiae]|uniref:Fas-binding factor 1 C-terminal domain-containing protein n=1 Tax=Anopheles coluzzii TaxID=1518534 RepID=A0A6E8W1L6_ANOCL|nr:fas-binding factor 1 [Anopheles coluzzii]XP_061517740.1 fas-binding factor 1 [Anopheles gambiae]